MNMEFLKSPWVWGAGLGLGVLIIMSRNSSDGGNSGPIFSASLASMTELNKAGMSLVAKQGTDAKDKAIAFANNDTTVTIKLLDVIQNMSNVDAVQRTRSQEINAGVTQSRIASYTYLEADRRANQTRRYLADLDFGIRSKELDTQKKLAKISADTQLWGAAIGGVSALGQTALKGAFGAV